MGESLDARTPIPPITPPALNTIEKGYQKNIGEIDRTSPRGLIDLNQKATKIYGMYARFSADGNPLGHAPQARKDTLRALTSHDFPANLPVKEHRKVYQAVHEKEELARRLIVDEIKDGATFGLKPYELEIVKASCEVGGAYDNLSIRWRSDVQQGVGNPKADELQLKNPYSVIVGDDTSGYAQVAWADRYPEEVSKIAGEWQKLADTLSSDDLGDEQAQIMAGYFSQYAKAIQSTDLETLEDQWRDVDRAWMRINGDTAMVHPIGSREYGYFDPNAIRIHPDMRLMVRVETLSADIKKTREALKRHLGERFGGYTVYQETANALETVQLFPGSDILITSLDFQPAGQNNPNDEIVAQEMGTKVFVNAEVSALRWESSKKAACTIFQQDTALIESVDPITNGVAVRLAGHEYAEPLFQTKETEEALGAEATSLHNEDMADGAVASTIRARIAEGDLPQDAALKHAISLLCVYSRGLAAVRGQESQRPYYIGQTLQGWRRMLGSGFVKQDEHGNWKIHPENLDKYYDRVEADFKTQVDIHEHKDKKGSDTYLAQAQETPEIQSMIKKVSPHTKFE